MKKTIIKLMFVVLTILMLVEIPICVRGAETEEKMEAILFIQENGEKIIYIKGLDLTEFKYAFSNEDNSDTITYLSSSKDSNGEYVAFISDNNNYENMFIMVNEHVETIKLGECKKITEKEIEDVESLTKRINVKTDEAESSVEMDNGTVVTTTIGKIVVKDEGKYQYQLFEVVDTNNSTEKLNDTAVELYNELEVLRKSEKMYDKLLAEITIRDDYNTLLKNAKWENAKNDNEIMQPENSQKGEKFIVILQEVDESGKTKRYDVQFMTCDRKDAADVEYTEKQEIKQIEKRTELPVTGENLALYIILGVIIIAIIVLAIKMKKEKAKEDDEKK